MPLTQSRSTALLLAVAAALTLWAPALCVPAGTGAQAIAVPAQLVLM